MKTRTLQLAALVLSAWAGSLWTICGVVVPGLFWLVADRKLAGSIATQFFYIETGLATLLGMSYWILIRGRMELVTKRCFWLAWSMPLLFFVVLRPFMDAARAAGDMARFGQLHGVSSTLFLIACVSVGVLAWRGATRPAT